MQPAVKYARTEWERRFLLRRFPAELEVTRTRRIIDRYIDGTRLRLRHLFDPAIETNEFKLTQKIPAAGGGPEQGRITTLYLPQREFEILAQLPARILFKTRYSVPPFGIDVFEGQLAGLVMAEAEFRSAEEASQLTLPSFLACEVTDDIHFTGGALVASSRHELEEWTRGHGIDLPRLDT